MIDPPKEGLPAVLMAEKSVLSAMLNEPQRFIGRASAEGIDADCFYLRRPVYDAIHEIFAADPKIEQFELISFIGHLQLSGTLDRCGGQSEICDIHAYTYGQFGAWTVWGQQLREAKTRRIAIISSMCLAEALDSDEAIQTATDTLKALKSAISIPSRSKDGKQSASEFIRQWKADFESTDAIPGKATGFDEIDTISGGMRAGELWIVCAKSTRGKSVMMIQIAAVALQRGETVAIFSLEMMAGVVTGRLVSVIGAVEYGAITQPKTSNKHDRAAIKRGIDGIEASNVWIDDTPNQTMAHIEAECQRILDITGALDLIVIDYMQIVKGEKQRGESREQEVARISMAGKQMAKKFNCPVLSASQLNSAGETRESRALEQDADTLLFIADDGVKIGKMRNGKRDQILRLFLHGDKQKFLEYQANQ